MKNLFLLLMFVLVSVQTSFGQQDPQNIFYLFNSPTINPAVAGTNDFLTIDLIHRDQWFNKIDGAPRTQFLSAHTPLKKNVGVGISMKHSAVGASNISSANLQYDYKIPFGKGKLSIGLSAGAINWRADYTVLNYKDPMALDESFKSETINKWMPSVGVGLYYYTDKYYLGLSAPHLINIELRESNNALIDALAQTYRHYYFMAGFISDVGSNIKLRPTLLLKNVGGLSSLRSSQNTSTSVGAPTSADIGVSALYANKLWTGLNYRTAIEAIFNDESTHDSIGLWMSYVLRSKWRIGAAYEYPLGPFSAKNNGSYELLLGYDFNYQSKNMATPRYF